MNTDQELYNSKYKLYCEGTLVAGFRTREEVLALRKQMREQDMKDGVYTKGYLIRENWYPDKHPLPQVRVTGKGKLI